MIYLGTNINDSYLLPISHSFYLYNNFYSVSCDFRDTTHKYRILTDDGTFGCCDVFEYKLPDILVYIRYFTTSEKIAVLNNIVEQKILNSI